MTLDTLLGFINGVALLPITLLLMGFYWVYYKRGTPVVIGFAGGLLSGVFSIGMFAKAGTGNLFASMYHIALGLLVTFAVSFLVATVVAKIRKAPVSAPRWVRIAVPAVLISIFSFILFNNHVIATIRLAQNYQTSPEVLEAIATKHITQCSPTLFEALANNPYTPEKGILYLYEHADTPMEKYQLMRSENMPCEKVKAFAEEYSKASEFSWMVAMAKRNHLVRCEVPEEYTISDDELMDRADLRTLLGIAEHFYRGKPPELIRRWIEIKQGKRPNPLKKKTQE
jgi:hypothetical protein